MDPHTTVDNATAMRDEGGISLLWASEAILKGALESEHAIDRIVTPALDPFQALLAAGRAEPMAGALREHGTRLQMAPDARRAVTLAHFAACSGRTAFAMIPNNQLDQSMLVLRTASQATLDPGAALCVVIEDHPFINPASDPIQVAERLDLPCIVPASIRQLRDAMEWSVKLSRADRRTVAVVVHRSILQSADTVALRPNRMDFAVDVLTTSGRRRKRRVSEVGGLLRVARRLELNRTSSFPNPGEKLPVGFLVVGPAEPSMDHLLHELKLVGRVPLLRLGLAHPIDEAAVGRLLTRCEQVVLLEPRPGTVESVVLRVAEHLRHETLEPAMVWGRQLPPDASGQHAELRTDEDVHPSRLARQIAHLLHAAWPKAQVASRLMSAPPKLPVQPPPRGESFGVPGTMQTVEVMLHDVQRWLDQREPTDEAEPLEPRTLAIHGVEPLDAGATTVIVEVWGSRRFNEEGQAAIRQAARAEQPWVIIVCVATEDVQQDVERLTRAAVPADRADYVRITLGSLTDRLALRDRLREAAVGEGLSVVIVAEISGVESGSRAFESSLREIDQLGFTPQQRVTWPADQPGAIRLTADRLRHDKLDSALRELATEATIDRLPRRRPGSPRFRVLPLLEQVEVRRTRAPSWAWLKHAPDQRPGPPQPIHGRQPVWRAHLAGFRGESPGPAARVLCEAGRTMGYTVRGVYDATSIAPGYHAYAQVLFTRAGEAEHAIAVCGSIPYGEADLLLGLDADETLRAIEPDPLLRVAHPDRTYAVMNIAPIGQREESGDDERYRQELRRAFALISHEQPRLVERFADTCRTWLQTDRVVDLVMLGSAFQIGLIPVTVQAIETALQVVEQHGIGRCREAFAFGRMLATTDMFFKQRRVESTETPERIARRFTHHLARRRIGGRHAAERYRRLVDTSLTAMPGLSETDRGREARRDFIVALGRTYRWGGYDDAERFAQLILNLYQVDRGDRGRHVTRDAVLPIAEAILVRDPIYLANMTISPEHERRIRQRLHVKPARGDELSRRYLTRIELRAFRRRFRVDMRTSDWAPRAVASLRPVWPGALRGTKRARALRKYMIDLARDAAVSLSGDYDRWVNVFSTLHRMAIEDTLGGMRVEDLKQVIEAENRTITPHVHAREPAPVEAS